MQHSDTLEMDGWKKGRAPASHLPHNWETKAMATLKSNSTCGSAGNKHQLSADTLATIPFLISTRQDFTLTAVMTPLLHSTLEPRANVRALLREEGGIPCQSSNVQPPET